MVKNKSGGNKSKRLARKHVQEEQVHKPARLKDINEECELYAVVVRIFGQGNCEVYCEDGVLRLCVMRKKFRGRSKRDNMVSINTLVLVATRDWETAVVGKKEKCDLLDVYSGMEVYDLKKDPNFNMILFSKMTQDGMHGTTGTSQSNVNGNAKNVSTSNDIGDGFEFSVDDEEGEKEEEQNISNTIGNYNDNEDELNIDDI